MSMATKTEDETSREITRFINAPRTRVYAAWTNPAQLKEWFGPVWVRTCDLIAEARLGEKFHWDVIDCEAKRQRSKASTAKSLRARRSFSPGNVARTTFGKTKSASSQ